MTRTFVVGERVTLRPDRASAYGFAPDRMFTVASLKPHKRFDRTWVYLAELLVPDDPHQGCVDSRELRLL